MAAGSLELRIVPLREAQHVGNAPRILGGCVFTSHEGRDAAEDLAPGCVLALVPREWAMRGGRRVTPDECAALLVSTRYRSAMLTRLREACTAVIARDMIVIRKGIPAHPATIAGLATDTRRVLTDAYQSIQVADGGWVPARLRDAIAEYWRIANMWGVLS